MNGHSHPRCSQRLTPLLVLLLVLSWGMGWHAGAAEAAEIVSCRYLKSEGTTIELELHIGSPPPTMLILVQRFPQGTEITSAVPPVKKFNPRKDEAKWLLKRLQPGIILFTVELDRPVAARSVSGEIRYMDPVSGKNETMQVMP